MKVVGDVLDYAAGVATDDVRRTLEWLIADGFAIEREIGGKGESFGNVLIGFTRGSAHVTVTRDRSQWFIELQPPWAESGYALQVLLSARDGQEPAPAEPEEFLAEQLPQGVSWALELPALIAWTEAADRAVEVAVADRQWREYTRARLGPLPG